MAVNHLKRMIWMGMLCLVCRASQLPFAYSDQVPPPSAIKLIPEVKKSEKPEEANQCELAFKSELERLHAKKIRDEVRIERLEAEIVRLEERIKAQDYP